MSGNALVRTQFSLDGGKTWKSLGSVSSIVIPTATPPAPPLDKSPSKVSATVGTTATDASIVLTWEDPPAGAPISYIYGRDGVDTAGSGAWAGPIPATTHAIELDKLVLGSTYNVTVTAVWPNAAYPVTVKVTIPSVAPTPVPVPNPDPTPVPSTAGRSIKLVGHSKMPFNVTIFNQGSADQAAMVGQAPNMGFPSFDGGFAFATRDQGWDAAKDEDLAAKIRGILDHGGIFVLSLPHSMDGDSLMNQKGARNAYKADQISFGQWLVSQGLNQEGLILSLDWESNGKWYHWTVASPGGEDALKASMKNFIDNLRMGGLNLAKFDLRLNMPSDGGPVSWGNLWLGPGYFSQFSIDGYDAYPAIHTDEDWERKQSDVHSLRGAIAQAGMFSTEAWPVTGGQGEGGNWHTSDGGGDNPYYWVCVFRELMLAPGRVWGLNIYNDNGAPANLFHGFDSNPNAFAKVRELVAAMLAK